MSDQPPQKRSLSEISHLFLSSVREKQTNGTPLPRRVPPKKPGDPAPQATPPRDVSIDLTPEEFEQVMAQGQPLAASRKPVEVTAILAAHLNGRQLDRVKDYARHLASRIGRVGLIELDASEFRLMSFEPGVPAMEIEDPESNESYDVRQMAQALEEMSYDVQRWLLLVPSPRTPEAKGLLRAVGHWTLLSTCDHDGVVASYRMLKGLSDCPRPRLSLALLDAPEDSEAQRVGAKLASVCRQFLDWNIEPQEIVLPAAKTIETLVLCCRPTRDKGQLAAAPQWGIVADFLATARAAAPELDEPMEQPSMPLLNDEEMFSQALESDQPARKMSAPSPAAAAPIPLAPAPAAVVTAVAPLAAPQAVAPVLTTASQPASDAIADVISLESNDVTPDSLLGAVLHHGRGDLVECPVRPPMCPDSRLAIARDRSVVLLAVARQGLSELRAIGQAYRWLSENRQLLGMAVPQCAIDVHQLPRLRLLVDQADVRADILQPMLQSEQVTVQAYRRLRWGGKMGLFLEAA